MKYTRKDLEHACRHYQGLLSQGRLVEAVKQFAQDAFLMCDFDSKDAQIVGEALSDLNIYGVFKYAEKSTYREEKIEEYKKMIEELENNS